MPFGPVNGPVIFIVFIHDMDTARNTLATSRGVVFDAFTGTCIIVDDLFSWVPTFERAVALLPNTLSDKR